ncbi:MAG: carboxymuconolactone decarboxylase family protein [Chitinophagaceae bacterium]|nr:MAG: carboxymuconolactone decarboxylase family protein [Chitinophagaceae bacterium]
MNKPLVKPIENLNNPELEELILFFNETLGFCPNSVLTMSHRPQIAKAFVQLNKSVMENKGRVNSGLKRLIGYICSFTAGCAYCQAHTIRAAERYGVQEVKLKNIWEYKTHPAFESSEIAALDFAIAASGLPNHVDQEISENLRKHWDEGEIVEILGVISLFGFLNRWNDSMATTLEEPAINSANKYFKSKNWDAEKHL